MQLANPVVFRSSLQYVRILYLAALAACFCLPAAWAAPDAAPCAANSENRQLDFWLGAWSISYPGAPNASSSKVIWTWASAWWWNTGVEGKIIKA